jgi:hypothetical protein
MTIYFFVEIIVRAYCYTEMYDFVTFMKSPFHLVDMFCVFTDMLAFIVHSECKGLKDHTLDF